MRYCPFGDAARCSCRQVSFVLAAEFRKNLKQFTGGPGRLTGRRKRRTKRLGAAFALAPLARMKRVEGGSDSVIDNRDQRRTPSELRTRST